MILATPTGSGKSLVAAGAIHFARTRGQRAYYTAPIKALVSEKFFDLCDAFGAENVGLLTGDASVNSTAMTATSSGNCSCPSHRTASLSVRDNISASGRWPSVRTISSKRSCPHRLPCESGTS